MGHCHSPESASQGHYISLYLSTSKPYSSVYYFPSKANRSDHKEIMVYFEWHAFDDIDYADYIDYANDGNQWCPFLSEKLLLLMIAYSIWVRIGCSFPAKNTGGVEIPETADAPLPKTYQRLQSSSHKHQGSKTHLRMSIKESVYNPTRSLRFLPWNCKL